MVSQAHSWRKFASEWILPSVQLIFDSDENLDFGLLSWCWNELRLVLLLVWNKCILHLRRARILETRSRMLWFEYVPQKLTCWKFNSQWNSVLGSLKDYQVMRVLPSWMNYVSISGVGYLLWEWATDKKISSAPIFSVLWDLLPFCPSNMGWLSPDSMVMLLDFSISRTVNQLSFCFYLFFK